MGKTTITKLLVGLYDEFDGDILINGSNNMVWLSLTLFTLKPIRREYEYYERYMTGKEF